MCSPALLLLVNNLLWVDLGLIEREEPLKPVEFQHKEHSRDAGPGPLCPQLHVFIKVTFLAARGGNSYYLAVCC